MPEIYNIYCDESCHLENDNQPVMLIGAVWCLKAEVQRISDEIRKLKEIHNASGELKWSKVCPSKLDFYLELVDYFFGESTLNFRCLIVRDKSNLDHDYFNMGDHDSFYYKMYYQMLLPILKESNQYNIFLDIKDSRSATKVNFLREVLCNTFRDYDKKLIPLIQNVRSHEVHLIQLADFFIGAVGYRYRYDPPTSKAKKEIIDKISSYFGGSLKTSTPPWEAKFNLFIFTPRIIRP